MPATAVAKANFKNLRRAQSLRFFASPWYPPSFICLHPRLLILVPSVSLGQSIHPTSLTSAQYDNEWNRLMLSGKARRYRLTSRSSPLHRFKLAHCRFPTELLQSFQVILSRELLRPSLQMSDDHPFHHIRPESSPIQLGRGRDEQRNTH